jgi:hypothetical protein
MPGQTRKRPQRPKSTYPAAEIPAETTYLALFRNREVCGDWMVEVIGLELETHHPVIEPVSAERIVGQAEFGRLLMFFCP